jgi:hypothetical protein
VSVDDLARQLAFWVDDHVDPEHATTFVGQATYTLDDWDELFIDSEQQEWRALAQRLVLMLDGVLVPVNGGNPPPTSVEADGGS